LSPPFREASHSRRSRIDDPSTPICRRSSHRPQHRHPPHGRVGWSGRSTARSRHRRDRGRQYRPPGRAPVRRCCPKAKCFRTALGGHPRRNFRADPLLWIGMPVRETNDASRIASKHALIVGAVGPIRADADIDAPVQHLSCWSDAGTEPQIAARIVGNRAAVIGQTRDVVFIQPNAVGRRHVGQACRCRRDRRSRCGHKLASPRPLGHATRQMRMQPIPCDFARSCTLPGMPDCNGEVWSAPAPDIWICDRIATRRKRDRRRR